MTSQMAMISRTRENAVKSLPDCWLRDARGNQRNRAPLQRSVAPYTALSPSSSSIRNNWLYLATRRYGMAHRS